MDLEAIFDAYHDALHRYLTRLLGDADLAADAAQEAFLKLAVCPPRHTQNLRAWLYTVATNYAFDTVKLARRRSELLMQSPECIPIGDPASVPDVSLERWERRERVRDALDSLRSRERTALLMRAEGFSYREIGAALNVPVNSVGVIATRALRKLAAVLQPYEAQLQ